MLVSRYAEGNCAKTPLTTKPTGDACLLNVLPSPSSVSLSFVVFETLDDVDIEADNEGH